MMGFCILFYKCVTTWFNSDWTGGTYMSLPGKRLKGHIYPTIMTPWWLHCDVI